MFLSPLWRVTYITPQLGKDRGIRWANKVVPGRGWKNPRKGNNHPVERSAARRDGVIKKTISGHSPLCADRVSQTFQWDSSRYHHRFLYMHTPTHNQHACTHTLVSDTERKCTNFGEESQLVGFWVKNHLKRGRLRGRRIFRVCWENGQLSYAWKFVARIYSQLELLTVEKFITRNGMFVPSQLLDGMFKLG